MTDKTNNLNAEELENVTGGYTEYEPSMLSQTRFIFTQAEVDKIKNALGITLEAGYAYKRGDITNLGIGGNTLQSVRDALSSIGVYKS